MYTFFLGVQNAMHFTITRIVFDFFLLLSWVSSYDTNNQQAATHDDDDDDDANSDAG